MAALRSTIALGLNRRRQIKYNQSSYSSELCYIRHWFELVFKSLCPLTLPCTILGIDPKEISRSIAGVYIQGHPVHHCQSPHFGSESESKPCLDTDGFISKMILRSQMERVGKEEGKANIMRML